MATPVSTAACPPPRSGLVHPTLPLAGTWFPPAEPQDTQCPKRMTFHTWAQESRSGTGPGDLGDCCPAVTGQSDRGDRRRFPHLQATLPHLGAPGLARLTEQGTLQRRPPGAEAAGEEGRRHQAGPSREGFRCGSRDPVSRLG